MQTRPRSFPLRPTQAAVNSHPRGAPAGHPKGSKQTEAPKKEHAHATCCGRPRIVAISVGTVRTASELAT